MPDPGVRELGRVVTLALEEQELADSARLRLLARSRQAPAGGGVSALGPDHRDQ